MAPTTEIVILKLKDPASSLSDSSPTATLWHSILSTAISQPGAQRLHWGVVIEDPSLVRLFIDWDTLAHHKTFEASEAYAPFVENVLTIFSEITLMAHTDLKDLNGTARDVFTSPASEMLSVFFPTEYTSAQQDTFEKGMYQFLANIEGKAPGSRAAAAGWGFESDIPNLKIEGEKGRAFFLFIGWNKVEDHLAFRGTEAYRENIHFIAGAEVLRGFVNMHMHGREVVSQ
jgi:hypothetical protein